jgi:hypothetical protein
VGAVVYVVSFRKEKLRLIKETRLLGLDDTCPAEETPNLKKIETKRSNFPHYHSKLGRN